jgi:hypothetical protein
VADFQDRSARIGRDNHGLIITGDGNIVYLGPDLGNYLESGLRHIRLRMHARALDDLKLAMSADGVNPDVYYLSAVAKLNGQKAFVASLACIREVEELIQAAIVLEEKGLYHYFLAYVRYDYYERKSLHGPTAWQFSLSRAWSLGVELDELTSLFTLLSVANPLPIHP